ncbi:hypothetical protein [Streptomyces sp. URMC 124]|uniref:hypothetical protein n=1 Tax=Streptomyces sp. URMC 124 TaxID=3423405 RepID=UPI003F1C73D9
MPGLPKRLSIGRPVIRGQEPYEMLLSEQPAPPTFASDPLSSVAYAAQEILWS